MTVGNPYPSKRADRFTLARRFHDPYRQPACEYRHRSKRSLVSLQLPLAPMGFFAVWIELANDVHPVGSVANLPARLSPFWTSLAVSIRRSSRVTPLAINAWTQRGRLPLPDHVCAGYSGLQYFCGTFGYGRRLGISGPPNLRVSSSSRCSSFRFS